MLVGWPIPAQPSWASFVRLGRVSLCAGQGCDRTAGFLASNSHILRLTIPSGLPRGPCGILQGEGPRLRYPLRNCDPTTDRLRAYNIRYAGISKPFLCRHDGS